MAQGEYDPSQELGAANHVTRAPPRGSQKTAGALGKGTVIASASKITEISFVSNFVMFRGSSRHFYGPSSKKVLGTPMMRHGSPFTNINF